MEKETPKTEEFDLRTHIRDPKTGVVIENNPYRLRVSRKDGEMFERPPGSGYFYSRQGILIKSPKEKLEIKNDKAIN